LKSYEPLFTPVVNYKYENVVKEKEPFSGYTRSDKLRNTDMLKELHGNNTAEDRW
jgi:hypothetical protein